MTSADTYHTLQPYSAPSWMARLRKIPSVRVHLAMAPTPIHNWQLPDVPENFKLCVKREDLTGCALSGNKVRKLEFLFGHILQNGYKHVTTIGSAKSNHCRATAIVASQLGIKCHLFFRSPSNTIKTTKGNLLLARMCGANIYLTPADSQYERDFDPRTKALAEAIWKEKGEKTYRMPAGGSDSVGCFGYLHAWQEMMGQGVLERFDDLVHVCGSGGTLCGLAIGNFLTGETNRTIKPYDNNDNEGLTLDPSHYCPTKPLASVKIFIQSKPVAFQVDCDTQRLRREVLTEYTNVLLDEY